MPPLAAPSENGSGTHDAGDETAHSSSASMINVDQNHQNNHATAVGRQLASTIRKFRTIFSTFQTCHPIGLEHQIAALVKREQEQQQLMEDEEEEKEQGAGDEQTVREGQAVQPHNPTNNGAVPTAVDAGGDGG